MQYEQIRLDVIPEGGNTREVEFKGAPLGRTTAEIIYPEEYEASVEIYQTDEENYVIYVSCQDESGEIRRADFTKTSSLDLQEVRSALKENDIYPGPMFSKAVYESLEALD